MLMLKLRRIPGILFIIEYDDILPLGITKTTTMIKVKTTRIFEVIVQLKISSVILLLQVYYN